MNICAIDDCPPITKCSMSAAGDRSDDTISLLPQHMCEVMLRFYFSSILELMAYLMEYIYW